MFFVFHNRTLFILTSMTGFCFFFFKQKTAYEMRISDWSSDVCSSDLIGWGGVIPEAARVAADVIIGQRVCMPGPSKLWQSWAKDGRKLIFEMDDDLWNVDPANERAYYFFRDQDIRRRLVENIRVAYAVNVSTPDLAGEVVQKTGKGNVHEVRR